MVLLDASDSHLSKNLQCVAAHTPGVFGPLKKNVLLEVGYFPWVQLDGIRQIPACNCTGAADV